MLFHGVRSTVGVALLALVAATACEDLDGGSPLPPPPPGLPGPPGAVNHKPVLSKQPSAITTENTAVSIDLLDGASDPDGDPLTVSVVFEDPHDVGYAQVELQRDNRTVKVTPLSSSGAIHIDYTVRDSKYSSVDGVATVTIAHRPTAFDASLSTDWETPSTIVLQGSDIDGNSLTFAIATPPRFGSVTGTPPNVTYTPATGYVGPDSFTFTASDGQQTSNSATVSIFVSRPNHAPTATPQSLTVEKNGSVAIVLAGSDTDGDALSFFAATSPAHGTLVNTWDGQLFYVPNTDYLGPDRFTFIARDASLNSAPATVSIDVVFINHAPSAFDRFFTLNEDSTASVTLFGSDQDGDSLNYAIQDKPKHGALTGTPPNLTYTPEANFSGTDSFTYVVSDAALTSTVATVTLQVSDVDDPPIASDGAVTTAEDTPVRITLRGSDIDSTFLTFSIASFPIDGSLTGSGTSWTYTPAPNANGTRSFMFRVSDGFLSATATVTITITPVNDAPQARNDFAATDAGEALKIDTLFNDVDVDGDVLALSAVTTPAHGHADIVTGQVVYTPNADFTGVDTFDYTVADPAGLTSTAHVTVGVGQFPVGAPTEVLQTLGVGANDLRNAPSLSSDGRYIAFTSTLPLVSDDNNNMLDVYVYDRGTRTISRVSESSAGGQADGISRSPQISASGRYVAFESNATNLVPGDTNNTFDVFRHDLVTGETVRVSVSSTGSQGSGSSMDPRISDDGNTIAFTSRAFDLVDSDANGAVDVFVRDMTAGTTTRVSVSQIGGDADLPSAEPAISGDGRFVAFTSAATNLVTGDGNGLADVFVRDLVTRTTSRVSISSNNVEANRAAGGASLSRDGRFVSFLTDATNLVTGASGTQVYVRDTRDLTTIRPMADSVTWARLSPDGRYLAVVSSSGVILRDRFAPATLVPPSAGTWTFPSFSGNGRYVAVLGTTNNTSLIVTPNPL